MNRDHKGEPTVSVFMCVQNESAWVADSIESILGQTFADFELLITDDGSMDGTGAILREFERRDSRVRTFSHGKNRGLASSLNEQIGLARGRYVARMDGDDIARPDRLQTQVAFLDEHPRVGIVGSYCREIDTEGRPVCLWERPTEDADLQRALLRYNPFIHSTIMLRKEIFSKTGPYDPSYRYAQDYELWLRAAQQFELANIPEPLIDLRVDLEKVARKNREARRCELYALYRHLQLRAYPPWYYLFLFRPLVLSIVPTEWMIRLKALQRRIRRDNDSGAGCKEKGSGVE